MKTETHNAEPQAKAAHVLPNGHTYLGSVTLQDGYIYCDVSFKANHLPHDRVYSADEIRDALNAAAPETAEQRDELLECLRLTYIAIQNIAANIGYPNVSDDCLIKLCNSTSEGIRAAIARAEKGA